MSTRVPPETKYTAVLEPLGDPGGHPVSLPVFARTVSGAAKVAGAVFPVGLRRLIAIRDGDSVVWEPPARDDAWMLNNLE